MKRILIASLLGLSLVASTHVVALATTVMKVDVPAMTQTSEWVVRATVSAVRNVDLRHEGRSFFTDVDLTVTEIYRGEKVPARYTMRLLGGEGADGLRLWIPGMPRFVVGQDAVLFLEKTSAGHIPCGLGQGVWSVRKGMKGQSWVTQGGQGMHLVQRGADGHLKSAHLPALTQARLLEDLAGEIYAAQQIQ